MIIVKRGKKWRDSGYYELQAFDENTREEFVSDYLCIVTRSGEIINIDMPEKDIIRIWSNNTSLKILE